MHVEEILGNFSAKISALYNQLEWEVKTPLNLLFIPGLKQLFLKEDLGEIIKHWVGGWYSKVKGVKQSVKVQNELIRKSESNLTEWTWWGTENWRHL